MKAEIKKEVFEKFHPKFMVGLLICSNLNNQEHLKEIDNLLEDVENLIKLNFNPITLKTHDLITAWEVALQKFGQKKHYCSSVETMMKNILQGQKIKKQNRLKDLCNFMSLKYLIPIDCFDLNISKEDLTFGVKNKDIIFFQGKSKLSEKLALKRNKKFNVNENTKKALVYLEALPPITKDQVKKTIDELADLIQTFCQAKVRTYFLDKNSPQAQI